MLKKIFVSMVLILHCNILLCMWDITKMKSFKKKPISPEKELKLAAHKYKPPQYLIDLIENNKEKFKKYLHMVPFSLEEIPNIYFKNADISRLINAEKIRTYIEEHNLDRLDVVKKYLYKIDNQWVILAEQVQSPSIDKQPLIDLTTTQQLLKIVEKFNFKDWHTWNIHSGIESINILYDNMSKKFVFIDTENLSFGKINPKIKTLRGAENLLDFIKKTGTKEAQEWLEQKIQELQIKQKNLIIDSFAQALENISKK